MTMGTRKERKLGARALEGFRHGDPAARAESRLHASPVENKLRTFPRKLQTPRSGLGTAPLQALAPGARTWSFLREDCRPRYGGPIEAKLRSHQGRAMARNGGPLVRGRGDLAPSPLSLWIPDYLLGIIRLTPWRLAASMDLGTWPSRKTSAGDTEQASHPLKAPTSTAGIH